MKKNVTKTSVIMLALLLAVCIALPLFPLAASAEPDYSIIRVKLSTGDKSTGSSYATSMSITLNGSYTIKEKPDVVLAAKAYTVQVSGNSIGLYDGGANLYAGSQFTLHSNRGAGANTISLYNEHYNATLSYLGDILFKPSSRVVNGATNYYITAINYAYIEEYLYGVVPHEMSNTWPIEALKAQAVVARGYAIRQISSSASYDVGDTSSDQVYKGFNAANSNAIAAVNATQKQVVKYNGGLVETFFAASNGGEVDIAPNVWTPVTPLPYQVVKLDPYDRRNPYSPQEQYVFTKAVTDTPSDAALLMVKSNYIQPKLIGEGKVSPVGAPIAVTTDFTLKEIMSMSGTTPADHLKYKDICGASTIVETINMHVKVGTFVPDGAGGVIPQDVEYDISMPASNFMSWGVFDNSSLRVYFIEEVKDGAGNVTGYNLRHTRYGHGIGLSQRGAQQMANESIGYAQIVQFYFPNTVLEESQYIHAPDATPAPAVTPPSAPVKPAIAATGTVTSSTLNVRSGPNTTSSKVGTLVKSNTVEIVKQNYTADWHQIWYNNQLAYVHKDYIAINQPQAPASPPPAAPGGKPPVVSIAKSKISKAYIYSSASTNSAKLGTLTRGKMAEVVKRNYNSAYHQLWYKGKLAYIKVSNVTVAYGNKYVVKANSAALKSSASASSPAIATLQKGDTFNKYGTSGNYIYINFKGVTGYIHKNALKAGTAAASSPPPASSTSVTEYGYTSASSVKVRSTPSTSGKLVATLSKGKTLQIIQKNCSPGWHSIKYNGKTAYISSSYVKSYSAGLATVTSSTLTLRSSSSSSSKALKTLKKGNIVVVLQRGSAWSKVYYSGTTGYVTTKSIT